ncbi:dihydrolipoyl dehydrogenase [Candidatus Woesearchaeota archaeon]|nr:dihydrolipoyl dehydrogenase [Candidatus Woesearchaeota archaeon]
MDYDVVVIGGGTSGLRAAIELSSSRKTALIEDSDLGGTCLNTGCIPTKAMLQASSLYYESKHLSGFGVNVPVSKVNFPKLMQRVRGIIEEAHRHIHKSIKRKNLTLIKARASFAGKDTVRAGNELIRAKNIIISTGSRNCVPKIKGLEKTGYITNHNMLQMEKLPKSVIIIGGGYISMELATFFNQLGSKVTILERHDSVLKMLDPEISELIASYYIQDGVSIMLGTEILEARKKGRMKEIVIMKDSNRKVLTADEIIVATGMMPNTDNLGLGLAGIKTDERCSIVVDSYLRTTNKRVYAMGDVIGKAMFAHAAKREEAVVINNIMHRKKKRMNLSVLPWSVFTSPPIAGVGLTETQARERGINTGILKAYFTQAGRAHIMMNTRGFVKVIFNRRNKRIVGCEIIGPRADDLIHEFSCLLNSSSPDLDTLRKTIHIHPTLSEVMESLEEE